MTGGPTSTAQTLDSLITTDINTSAEKALSNPWKAAEAMHFYILCQRQLYQKYARHCVNNNRNYTAALKTSIRLIEYEKELSTKVVYSLVAVAAAYSGMWNDCSKAFVKLENMDGIATEEKEKYETMAVQLFSRKSPSEPRKATTNCPGKTCDAKVSEFDTNCAKCGSYFSACVASGQSILEKKYFQCRGCKHKSLERELEYLNAKHCPLCHSPLGTSAA